MKTWFSCHCEQIFCDRVMKMSNCKPPELKSVKHTNSCSYRVSKEERWDWKKCLPEMPYVEAFVLYSLITQKMRHFQEKSRFCYHLERILETCSSQMLTWHIKNYSPLKIEHFIYLWWTRNSKNRWLRANWKFVASAPYGARDLTCFFCVFDFFQAHGFLPGVLRLLSSHATK